MTRISSSATRYLKIGVPVVAFAVLAAIAAIGLIDGLDGAAIPLLFISIFVASILGAILSATLFKLADEVIDHGTHLVIRRGKQVLKIRFEELSSVSYSAMDSSRAVHLNFATKTELGRMVSFIPKDAPVGFRTPETVESLRKRVKTSKQSSGDA